MEFKPNYQRKPNQQQGFGGVLQGIDNAYRNGQFGQNGRPGGGASRGGYGGGGYGGRGGGGGACFKCGKEGHMSRECPNGGSGGGGGGGYGGPPGGFPPRRKYPIPSYAQGYKQYWAKKNGYGRQEGEPYGYAGPRDGPTPVAQYQVKQQEQPPQQQQQQQQIKQQPQNQQNPNQQRDDDYIDILANIKELAWMGGIDTELTPDPEENTKKEFFKAEDKGTPAANEWDAEMEDAAQHEQFNQEEAEMSEDEFDDYKDATGKLWYVYILASKNPAYKTSTYVGMTREPHKRLQQHNKQLKGGAKYTTVKGPWEFLMYISGFPDRQSTLQAEWQIKNMSNHSPQFLRPIGRIRCVIYCLTQMESWTRNYRRRICQEKYTIRIQSKYMVHMRELEKVTNVRMLQIDNECLNFDAEEVIGTKKEEKLAVSNKKQITIKQNLTQKKEEKVKKEDKDKIKIKTIIKTQL